MKPLGSSIGASSFPLSIQGRYLISAQGSPFLIVGESAWGLIHRLTLAQVDSYIADRKSRGFNAAMMMLIRNQEQITGGSPASNVNGDAPFSGTALIPANVNAAYFSHADSILQKFRTANMLVLLAACYNGFDDADGWWDDLTSDTVATNWGEYIGARYNATDYPNIIWVGGGDRNPPNSAIAEALQVGIANGGGTQLQTYHTLRYNNAFAQWGTAKSWLRLGNIYTDDGSGGQYIYSHAATEYARSGPHPFFGIEFWYADEHEMTDTGVIVQMWQCLLSAGCGFVTGTADIWKFTGTFVNEYGSDANVGVGRIASFAAAYPWQTLVPKRDASLVSSALGDGPSGLCPALGDYPGGKFAAIIVPTATSPTVVMTNFSQGSVRARWLDLKTGEYTTASGSPFANTGSQSITHPGNNSMGTSAWVLVLD